MNRRLRKLKAGEAGHIYYRNQYIHARVMYSIQRVTRISPDRIRTRE
jgi:hypothetical protein